MQIITISGNLGRDPEMRSTQGGDTVLSFSVGVQNGFGRDSGSNWYRCSVWGKRADSLNSIMRKGQRVFVTGALTIGEYNGKPQYDVRVSEVDVVKGVGNSDTPSDEPRQTGGGGGGYTNDDLDDDVPFAHPYPGRNRNI